MKIGIVTPAPPGSRYGNRVTALRWARILRGAGHRVSLSQVYAGERIDLLIALHARRSAVSIRDFHRRHPVKPIIVALTGTDLYGDLQKSSAAMASLKAATRIVVLQPKALDELPKRLREKTRVIHQSVGAVDFGAIKFSAPADLSVASAWQASVSLPAFRRSSFRRTTRAFDVCVIGHLRPVKDPFRAAMAARLLSKSSRVRVIHVGGAMKEEATVRARAEMKRNPRYRWLGEQPAWRVRRILERSRLMVLSSRMEGGANVLGEAISAGTAVLATRIAGNVGILGDGYAGYFEVGDTEGLARLMERAEEDEAFLRGLQEHCRRLVPLFNPVREATAWQRLLEGLQRDRRQGEPCLYCFEPEPS